MPIAEVFRLEYARLVASVPGSCAISTSAEEIAQEAFEQALDHWPADGMPDRPGAWLLTTGAAACARPPAAQPAGRGPRGGPRL